MTMMPAFGGGVVHVYVGQKLFKPYILRVFWLTNYELFQATFE
jgi:hypothetical protein